MAPAADVYPIWKFYPSAIEPPAWVAPVVGAFAAVRPQIDSRLNVGVSSDAALAALRPELVRQGFKIEGRKTKAGRIRRPVLFGEVGRPVVAYDVDGFHPEHGIVLEVEAGRGAANNADYRDLIRASLLVDARFLLLAMMLHCHLRERAPEAPPRGDPSRRLLTRIVIQTQMHSLECGPSRRSRCDSTPMLTSGDRNGSPTCRQLFRSPTQRAALARASR